VLALALPTNINLGWERVAKDKEYMFFGLLKS
jgi:hypothetical protein